MRNLFRRGSGRLESKLFAQGLITLQGWRTKFRLVQTQQKSTLMGAFSVVEEPNGLDATNISYILEEDFPIKTML